MQGAFSLSTDSLGSYGSAVDGSAVDGAVETVDSEILLDAILDWASKSGFELYPHQEEAVLELLAENNVVLATPTGSGKSLVALAGAFITLAQGGKTVYTAPTKALVSEKFFELVSAFGADRVGMVTGDVSVNAEADVIVCTAEIFALRSLRFGVHTPVNLVIMDEFHYYGDLYGSAYTHLSIW